MKRYPIVFAAMYLLLSCRGSSINSNPADTTAAKTSAIDGLVLRGPLSPVQRQGEPNEGPLAGAQVTITNAMTGAYTIIAKVVSDSNGRFYAKVNPGTYTCTPEPFANMIFPRPEEPSTVTVSANTSVRDTLRYDTGIRYVISSPSSL
jgi:hypothetical protein